MSELQERCDCKENYKDVEQDEIQSAYFGNTCFRIFTACSYYNGHGKLSKNPITIITEELDHSIIAVFTCFSKVAHNIQL